ncbi:hypothetical protein [Sphingomonas sp.]|uniref:hypothetical protein n=1 Tax=Sphingomonas sp. TaxID=28214 RepID=UPI0025E8B8EE|nr:hypothetical protein [Sphingomonas sp.]MBV9527322.1 hypothetical protein [Sphingomonas sp.]
MRTRLLIGACAAGLAAAIPALAQQAVPPQPAPAQPSPAPAPQPASPATESQTATVPESALTSSPGSGDSNIVEISAQALPPPPPPVEYPGFARRDPWTVGRLDPSALGLGVQPWGTADGAFLSSLMRHMDTPLASRWEHMALRDALLAKAHAPANANPIDWAAERAWLLLRMGEASAARMIVAGVDTDRFTPKMVQVGVQSALANADPAALCPLEPGIRQYDQGVRQLVAAMCASLAGEPESASAQIEDARRHGRIGGIDLTLAEKIVGAGGNTGRATTIEWDPVDSLTAWRFGLASAAGLVPPDRLASAASPQLRAFAARLPLLTADQRLPSALIAGGLGVFSSQSLIDLYSTIYDATDPGDLATTDAWQVRQAFVGKDRDARLSAIRKLLDGAKDPLTHEATRALIGRAATLIDPDPALSKDAPELISAMLAAGYDRAAERWAGAVARMSGDDGDRAWAMLALAAPDGGRVDVSSGRVRDFIGNDNSRNKVRSALLVAGLVGLGRMETSTAESLSGRYGLGIGHTTSWTTMIDAAAARGQTATVLVLAGTGLQTQDWRDVPASHLFHVAAGLERTGQDFTARMIAAEALSRT